MSFIESPPCLQSTRLYTFIVLGFIHRVHTNVFHRVPLELELWASQFYTHGSQSFGVFHRVNLIFHRVVVFHRVVFHRVFCVKQVARYCNRVRFLSQSSVKSSAKMGPAFANSMKQMCFIEFCFTEFYRVHRVLCFLYSMKQKHAKLYETAHFGSQSCVFVS